MSEEFSNYPMVIYPLKIVLCITWTFQGSLQTSCRFFTSNTLCLRMGSCFQILNSPTISLQFQRIWFSTTACLQSKKIYILKITRNGYQSTVSRIKRKEIKKKKKRRQSFTVSSGLIEFDEMFCAQEVKWATLHESAVAWTGVIFWNGNAWHVSSASNIGWEAGLAGISATW